jgi:hypothetical protein
LIRENSQPNGNAEGAQEINVNDGRLCGHEAFVDGVVVGSKFPLKSDLVNLNVTFFTNYTLNEWKISEFLLY